MKKAGAVRKPPAVMNSMDVLNPSNSIEHAELAMITQGFRPDFNKNEEGKLEQVPVRTMKTKKLGKKKKKKGKRVLKRVHNDATSQQSSFSILESEYVVESGNDLELDSKFVDDHEEEIEDRQNGGNISPIREESEAEEDDKSLKEASSAHQESSQNQVPSSDEGRNESSSNPESSEEEDDDSVPDDSENISRSSSHRYMSHKRPNQSSKVFGQ